MLTFLLLTLGFILAFASCLGIGRHKEVVDNWEKYRRNPLYIFTAFLYKPETDPRSRWQFANDNFADVIREYIGSTLKALMAPIMMIFQVMGGGLTQSIGGVGKIQGVFDESLKYFDKITEVFDRRYKSILHRLVMTFQKLQTTMSRVWGIAASTIYQSLAVIGSILSTLDLIMKIVIIILVILVAIVIFLFLFLWPVIPVVLTVIGIITAAGLGGAVGGMASTFCFTGDTPVVLADGSTQSIQSISIGTETKGGTVLGVLEFQQTVEDLYDFHGIRVSGSHIVYDPQPCHVANHPSAVSLPPQETKLYCLITSNQRIPILTEKGIVEFADWEEIDEEGQADWNRFVFETLNPGCIWNPSMAILEGESVFHPSTKVRCPEGSRCISTLHPGMMVLDANGEPTRIVGVVDMDSSCAGTAWTYRNGKWQQITTETPNSTLGYVSLITEAGTFQIESDNTWQVIRDFTDVGLRNLPNSYGMVLNQVSQMKSSC